jgi:DNA-binding response OmpR family regulator
MARLGNVLVIEDDGELRRLYRTALLLDGFDVAEAGNGLEALRHLESTPFDLIVLDMGLPALSGRAFLLELTAKAGTRKIPVVIVTGSSKTFTSLKVARVLRKPVSTDQLVETVRYFVRSTADKPGGA